MADRKNVNKYYPPDWDPSKGSLNQYHGQHPLRERANKLHLGILVIRFEMPFNIWCEKCKSHIGKGVRYNADKKKVGMYHSTIIYEFTMNCHLCGNHIVVRTDPATTDYLVVSGGRRKIETHDTSEEESQVHTLPSDEEKKRLIMDPIFRLETTDADKKKVAERKERVEELTELQQRMLDDYGQNSLARKKFRTEKKHLAALTSESTSHGFRYHLLPSTDADIEEARTQTYATSATKDTIRQALGMDGLPSHHVITAKAVDDIMKIKIKAGSIFPTTTTPTSKHAVAASSHLAAIIHSTARGAVIPAAPARAHARQAYKPAACIPTSFPVAIKRKGTGKRKGGAQQESIQQEPSSEQPNSSHSRKKARHNPDDHDTHDTPTSTTSQSQSPSSSNNEPPLVSSAYGSDSDADDAQDAT